MSSPKEAFNRGVAAFKAGQSVEALQQFSLAIQLGANSGLVYDSRAAVLEKLGRYKEALADSKRVINMIPDRWQGYSRSARLFLAIEKFDAALTMANLAIEKAQSRDSRRRSELQTLLQQITVARDNAAERKQAQLAKTRTDFGGLPVELAMAVFRLVVEDDSSRVFILAGVCQSWRSAVLNHASLWAHLTLTSTRPERKAKLLMARCRGRLQSLNLVSNPDNIVLALRELKNANFDRLRSLRIKSLSLDVIRTALPAFTHPVVAGLHDIHLQDLNHTGHRYWLWEPADMQLRSLVATNSLVDWPAVSQHCTGLRTLSFTGALAIGNWIDLYHVLQVNVCLETLHLFITSEAVPADLLPTSLTDIPREPPSNLELRHVFSFTMGGRSLFASSLFQRISLPSVQALQFQKTDTFNALPAIRLTTGIKSLQELRVVQSTLDPSELLRFLREATNLHTLQLQHCNSTYPIAEAIASSSDPTLNPEYPARLEQLQRSQIICPLLTDIDFSYSADLQSGPIVRLVKTRLALSKTTTSDTEAQPQAIVAPIASVVLDACPLIDSSILPWLRSVVPSVSCVYMTKKEAKKRR